jgi:hypothetical protein
MSGKYDHTRDRESAYEMLMARADKAAAEAERLEQQEEDADEARSTAAREFNNARRYDGSTRSTSRSYGGARSKRSTSQQFGDAVTSAVIKELKGTTGRRIVRGILGGLFKGR